MRLAAPHGRRYRSRELFVLEGITISAFRLHTRRGASGVVAAFALIAAYAAPAPASSGPHVAQSAVRSWQVPAPDWTPSNKEAGRVDDLLRVGRRLFVAGNFTELCEPRAASPCAGRTWRRCGRARGGSAVSHRGSTAACSRLPRPMGCCSSAARSRRSTAMPVTIWRRSTCAPGTSAGKVRDLHIRGAVECAGGDARGPSTSAARSRRSAAGGGRSSRSSPPRGGRYRVARGWKPRANAEVRAIVVVSSRRIVAGGDFTSVSGRSGSGTSSRSAAGRRGRVKRWASHPKAEILDLACSGRSIYAAEAGSGGTALRYHARRRRPPVVLQDRRQRPGRDGRRRVPGVRDARRQRRAAQEPRHVGVRAQPPDRAAQDLHAVAQGQAAALEPGSHLDRGRARRVGALLPAAETSTPAATSPRSTARSRSGWRSSGTSERVRARALPLRDARPQVAPLGARRALRRARARPARDRRRGRVGAASGPSPSRRRCSEGGWPIWRSETSVCAGERRTRVAHTEDGSGSRR